MKYLLLCLLASIVTEATSTSVILVPGIGGSVLTTCQQGPMFSKDEFGQVKRATIVSDCRRVYLDYVYADQMSKEYLVSTFDPKTLRSTSVNNYTLSVSWAANGLDAIDTLDPDLWFFSYRSWYFHETIIDFRRLLSANNVTLVGFPYDWRQHVCEESVMTSFYAMIKRSHPPYIIVTHSMGALVFQCALLRYPEIAPLIEGAVFIAPPLGGSFMAIQSVLWGYDFGIPYTWMGGMKVETSRSVALGIGSVPCLLPFPTNQTFITYQTLDGKNHSINNKNLVDFLSDATGNETEHYSVGSLWIKSNALLTFPATVVIGTEIGTPIGYDVPRPVRNPSDIPSVPMVPKNIRYGPGDGTVPSDWVEGFLSAFKMSDTRITIRKYIGTKNHVDMLSDDDLMRDITDIIKGYLSTSQ